MTPLNIISDAFQRQQVVSAVNPAEGGKCDLLSVLVSLRHKDGFLLERTYNSYGGEHKNAQRKGLI